MKSMLGAQAFLIEESIHAVELQFAAMILVTMTLISFDRAQW